MAQRTAEKNAGDERAPELPGRPPPARALPRAVACVAGGVLLYLAFPPIGLWYLAPAGVAALTLAVHRLPARRAAWAGYLGGLAFLLPALAWVRPIGQDAWLALVAIESLCFALMAVGTALVTRLRGWPVWAATLWVVQEWVRGAFPFGGFPWVRVAFSQGHTAFTPYAALGGAPLVTFAVALCGTLLAALALRLATRRALVPAAPLLAGALAVPLLAYAVPGPGEAAAGAVRVGVIQGDVPGEGLGFLGDEPAVVLRNHADKTHELARAVRAGRVARPDIVIWPENSTDIDPYRSSYAYEVIDAAVRDIGVPVLVGAVVRTPDGLHRYTRGIVWDPRTGPGAYYDKQKLVPFGEFVPYREIIAKIVPRVGLVGLQSLPGARDGDLRMGPVTVGAVSCYEVAFDGVVRATVRAGGSPLVVQTNNATYSLTGQPSQQLAMSQLRAVEHGRAVITAATTGISAAIDPSGEIRWRAPERVPDMAVVTVPLRTGETLATRAGGLPELALCLAGLAAVAVALAGRRRRGPAPEEPDGNQPG